MTDARPPDTRRETRLEGPTLGLPAAPTAEEAERTGSCALHFPPEPGRDRV